LQAQPVFGSSGAWMKKMDAPVLLDTEGNMLKEQQKLTVGAYLSQERKRKEISLVDISKVTRIAVQYLEALERDEFKTLPASIFVRGFLRTYAVHIGLDPKEVLRIYEAQMSSLAEPEMERAASRKKAEPLVKYISTLFIIAIAVGIAFFYFVKETNVPPPSPPASPPETIQPGTPLTKASPSESPAARDKEPPKTLEAKKPEKGLEGFSAAVPSKAEGDKKKEQRQVLKVQATELTWLRIQSDDLPDVEALLHPMETATWTARRQFKITVGNAGGTEISFNGKPLGALGASGEVVHLVLPNEMKPPAEEKKEP
jgi:cytoskeleton protein RodZ